jgi:hypothetical protein
MSRRIQLALLAVLVLVPVLLVGNCTKSFQAAVGPNQDVSLFADFPVGDARLDQVREFLARKRPTPVRPESPFRVQLADSLDFEHHRDWRNLAFVTDLTGERWSARRCRKILGATRTERMIRSGADYELLADVWADGQTVLVVHAADGQKLDRLMAEHGERILAEMNHAVVQGLQKTLYLSGEQTELEEGIRSRLGFTVRIPDGWFVEEQTENRFLRMKRIEPGEPAMFLFVYYQEQTADTLSPSLALAVRDTLAAIYSGGDRVDPSRTWAQPARFYDQPAIEINGLYQNDSPPMGGPFRLFAFHAGRRLYLVDLSVFNPPGEKTPQLRILEAIARTFRPDHPV